MRDVAQNYRASGTIGTFNVNLAFAYLSGSTLVIDFAAGQNMAKISDLGSGVISVIEGQSLNFNSSSFSNITIDGTSGTDHVVADAVLTQPITYLNGGGGNDTIEVTNNGGATLGADAAHRATSR